MRAARATGALAAALMLGAAPALAADPVPIVPPSGNAALSANVDAAIANATSYRIDVAGPNGLSLEIRTFRPDRVKIESRQGGTTTDSIVVGTSMYYRGGGGEWKAYPVPPVKTVRKNRLYMAAPDTLLEPLADRTEGGAAVGAFRSPAAGNGQVPGLMECTYDKVTYRPHTCSITLQGFSSPLVATYAGWDDPANAVEPPPGVPPPSAQPPAAPGAPH